MAASPQSIGFRGTNDFQTNQNAVSQVSVFNLNLKMSSTIDSWSQTWQLEIYILPSQNNIENHRYFDDRILGWLRWSSSPIVVDRFMGRNSASHQYPSDYVKIAIENGH